MIELHIPQDLKDIQAIMIRWSIPVGDLRWLSSTSTKLGQDCQERYANQYHERPRK